MRKVKEMVSTALLTLLFVGMFYIGMQINAGAITRPQGCLIMVSGFVAVISVCIALTKGDK